MLFLLLSFSCYAFTESLGSTHTLINFKHTYDEEGNISIDINIYDYYIIFSNFPLNTTLYEYTSSDGFSYKLSDVISVDNIQLYRHIEFPFAKQIISIKTPGTIAFTYGSLPSICTKGIIFSNYASYSILLSRTTKNYTHIGKNEDKCVIFVVPSVQEYVVSLVGVNSELLLYAEGEPVNTYMGTNFKQFRLDCQLSPAIFRFISDDVESSSIKISMHSSGDDPSFAWTMFYDPTNKNICPDDGNCTLYKALHLTTVFIVIGSLFGIGIVFAIIYYILVHTRCSRFGKAPPKEEKIVFPSSETKGENRSEPAGYFAMDPILRPREYM